MWQDFFGAQLPDLVIFFLGLVPNSQIDLFYHGNNLEFIQLSEGPRQMRKNIVKQTQQNYHLCIALAIFSRLRREG